MILVLLGPTIIELFLPKVESKFNKKKLPYGYFRLWVFSIIIIVDITNKELLNEHLTYTRGG